MALKKITINSVKALSPGQTIWDSEIKGFGCRCQKESKTFILKYRFGKGRTARQYLYTIGKLGSPWTPEMARDEAKKVLGRVNNGENPAAERQQERHSGSVDEAFQRFMQDGAGKRRPRTQEEYQRMYDRLVKQQIGKHRVKDVNDNDIERLHESLAQTPAQANRLLQMLSAFFNWCEGKKQKYRPIGSNPCREIKKYPETNKERFLSEKELFALSSALSQYDREYQFKREMSHKKNKQGDTEENTVTAYVTAAIRMLLFTGARRGEILGLRWEQVDFQNRLLRLQESKTGQKTIYLSAPALQILHDIPRMEGNPYVFCGREDGAGIVNIKDPWRRVCQMATIIIWGGDEKLQGMIEEERAKLPPSSRIGDLFDAVLSRAKRDKITLPKGLMDVRVHDLRHSFASVGVGMKYHLKIVGSLLGHSTTKVTERYSHLSNDPLQLAADAIGAKIFEAMNNRPNLDNVVGFKK